MVVVRCLILCSKFAKIRLSAGLRPDPLGSIQRSPRPSSRMGEGRGKGRRKGRREREGEGKKGEGEKEGGKGRGGRREGFPPNESPGYGPAQVPHCCTNCNLLYFALLLKAELAIRCSQTAHKTCSIVCLL